MRASTIPAVNITASPVVENTEPDTGTKKSATDSPIKAPAKKFKASSFSDLSIVKYVNFSPKH